MTLLGLIREEKIPADSRVALTPSQCRWLEKNYAGLKIIVQSAENRCYTDKEYSAKGIAVAADVQNCDILLGIKEIPVESLIANKTYLFFSHTKKLQPYNQRMFRALLEKKITLIDYECLEHDDGARVIGFGFFAGVVGAHNGMIAYGKRTGKFVLDRINSGKTFRHLMHTYFGLKLPNLRIAITGSGRVAHGVLEVMNLLGIHEVEPEDYLENTYEYPVYVHLKGDNLYLKKIDQSYNRKDFHQNPTEYYCKFSDYIPKTDILMNGIYWEKNIPRLFELEDLNSTKFHIQTIADITDDTGGSVPCNISESTIENPVYGVDKSTFQKTDPFLPTSVDVMAIGNLPNELPRDASRYFGEQLIKFVLPDVLDKRSSKMIDRAMIIDKGTLTDGYKYMSEYGRQ